MIVELRIPLGCSRLWHRRLADALSDIPKVVVRISAGTEPVRSADLLFSFEKLLSRSGAARLADRAPPPDAPRADGKVDLVVDVTASAGARQSAVLSLTAGGTAVDDGVLSAVLDGEDPVLTLAHEPVGAARSPIARWVTAVENRRSARAGMDAALARAIQLVVRTVARIARGDSLTAQGDVAGTPVPETAARRASAAGYAAASLAARIRERLKAIAGRGSDWFVAIRRTAAAEGIPDLSAGDPFRRLPDDGRRFFADPFPFMRDGRTVVFVEELPYATGKGIIAAVEVSGDGAFGPAVPVIETPVHLSYPHVFEDDGVLWMVPEGSAGGTVDLWRCVRFPDRWEHHAVLIQGSDLSDATLVRTGTGWMMTAASRPVFGSSWDALDVWTAPTLLGPWTPSPDNPVLVDVRSARPAGGVFRDGEALVRPVQDCGDRYGAGLAFARIDGLSPDPFAQTILCRHQPPAPFVGLHSYNRAGGLEAIDLFGPERPLAISFP